MLDPQLDVELEVLPNGGRPMCSSGPIAYRTRSRSPACTAWRNGGTSAGDTAAILPGARRRTLAMGGRETPVAVLVAGL
jgi:hypothetical protein